MSADRIQTIDSLLAGLTKLMARMTPEERVHFLLRLDSEYCRHCGNRHEYVTRRCQCNNDQ